MKLKMLKIGLKDTNMILKTQANTINGQTITVFNHLKTQKFQNYRARLTGLKLVKFHQFKIRVIAELDGHLLLFQLLNLRLQFSTKTQSYQFPNFQSSKFSIAHF